MCFGTVLEEHWLYTIFLLIMINRNQLEINQSGINRNQSGINRKIVNTIWFGFDLTRFGKDFSSYLSGVVGRKRRTQRNLFAILSNQPEIRSYLPCTDWFGTADGHDSFAVPNQSDNSKYNLISGWFNKIMKRNLCVCTNSGPVSRNCSTQGQTEKKYICCLRDWRLSA